MDDNERLLEEEEEKEKEEEEKVSGREESFGVRDQGAQSQSDQPANYNYNSHP